MTLEKAPPGVDPLTPSVARMYDYFLGGKDHFAVDREAAEAINAISPDAKELARANREFLGRAVRHLIDQGVRQFLDVGAGLPTRDNVHEVALRHAPDCRVVYVDNDPMVLVHARAILADHPNVIVAEGDLREPGWILGDPEVRAHLDLSQPVAVLMVAVLHFLTDDEEVRRHVAGFRDALAPGSHLVISHMSPGDADGDDLAAGREIYSKSSAGGLAFRTHDEVLALFDGFTLDEPGLVEIADWRPDDSAAPAASMAAGGAVGLAGVGRLDS
ncbi:SAM-dependent methyltransferase [Herbidospora daliensis]|uniref:SAM-dependent methyltransferase n=1 Tax=Herbidospora daliensis TaxID=295585 RepID=UPI0009FC32F4|nr:SAM-dependent methyltransferase [Herbidospora daliensis]